MTKSALQVFLQEQPCKQVKLVFADIDGVLRGKLISVSKLLESLEKGIGFCDVVFGWDAEDQLIHQPDGLTGWHTGFPDQFLHVDIQTLRTIPWQENMPLLLADFSGTVAGETACPRSLLKRIVSRAEAMGFVARFAQEFEWFNFKEDAVTAAQKNYQQLSTLSTGMFGYSSLRVSQHAAYHQALFKQLAAMGIAVEALHTETGPGVLEAAMPHQPALTAADHAVLLKAGVKEVAHSLGIMASFMAKWNAQLPGCSGHLHQSLWDGKQQQNLFYSSDDPRHMSQLMQHYIAGQLYCLPHLLPMYAPTINSYKRLVAGTWAPTTVSWGIENRTTAIRVISHFEKDSRVETRIPGSDSNPYLAMAAALASGLYGIQHALPLRLPAVAGNAYTKEGLLPLHKTLADATYAMQQSQLAKELLGEKFVAHFAHTRLHECEQYNKAVTNWELQRYFEII